MVLFCILPLSRPWLNLCVWIQQCGWAGLHLLGLRCLLHHLDPGLEGQTTCFPQHIHLSTSSASVLSSEKAPSLARFPQRPCILLQLPEPSIILFDREPNVFALNITPSKTKCFEGTFIFQYTCLSSLPLNGSWNLGKGKAKHWQQLQDFFFPRSCCLWEGNIKGSY